MTEQNTLQAEPAELTAHRPSLNALTGVRFFAAIYVVAFHTRIGAQCLSDGHRAAGYFFLNGFLAVPMFFLLSGFILAYTYAGQLKGPGDFRRFWEARFARIWPVYAVSLVLASLPGLNFPTPGVMAAALLMVQAWNPWDTGMAGAWNLVCWTLSVEAFFYLCFPWVQVWLEKRGSRAHLGWIVAMLATCVAINSGSRTLGYTALGIYRWIPFPLVHLPEFLVGVGLGGYFLKRLARPTVAGRWGAWTYGGLGLTLILLCKPAGRWTSVVVAGFLMLIWGLAGEATVLSRLLSTKLALLGGGISYSVYLMQMPVKYWVQGAADHYGQRSSALRMTCSTVLLLVISLILFKAVENPARKVIRSAFARLERRRVAKGHESFRFRENTGDRQHNDYRRTERSEGS